MRRRTKDNLPEITVVKNAEECLAKTYCSGANDVRPGRNVFDHCAIVGSVAKEVLDIYPERVQHLFPKGFEVLAACHDVGKLSPTFYLRLKLASGNITAEERQLGQELGLPCEEKALSDYEHNNWGGHPGVSFLTIDNLTHSRDLAWIVGAHHGVCPKTGTIAAESHCLGGVLWEEKREQFVIELERFFKESLPKPPSITLYLGQLLAGLTTVSDWIGSGEFFDNPVHDWKKLIKPSVKASGFAPQDIAVGLKFGEIFRSTDGEEYIPNGAQKILAESVKTPGVYILEAPMGTGKTEAALYAAYQVLQRKDVRGLYFALPSQLTANKICERFVSFISKIEGNPAPVQLLHAKAADFLERVNFDSPETNPGGSWFAYRKRGILAPYAVGTLDQALLAVMAVRFNFLRTFGLAGKVVIIDEVHSYDAYTNVLLVELLKMLRALGCFVIILSATLTRQARAKLLGCPFQDVPTQGYPQISYSTTEIRFEVQALPRGPSCRVKFVLKYGEQGEIDSIEEVISRASEGQQVLWIENDVKSSQEIYRILSARVQGMPIRIGLMHSRFTTQDRMDLENDWVDLYGKRGWKERSKCGRILVGTQILEQSLDIDADFLVSRVTVMDMFFQRIGRLWRHDGAPRSANASREVWIVTPTLETALENTESAFGRTAFVYWPYYLCRTLQVLSRRKDSINEGLLIPDEIPILLEQTYEDRQEDGMFSLLQDKLRKGDAKRGIDGIEQRERKARSQVALSFEGMIAHDEYVSTRYVNPRIQTADIVLVHKFELDPTAKESRLELLDGLNVTLPWSRARVTLEKRKEVANSIAKNTVRVSLHDREKGKFRVPSDKASKGFPYVTFTGKNNEDLYLGVVTFSGRVETWVGEQTDFFYSKDMGWERQGGSVADDDI